MYYYEDFLFGGLVAAVPQTTIPLMRLKLILQAETPIRAYSSCIEGTPPLNGVCDTVRLIIKREGFLGMWRGNLPGVVAYYPTQLTAVAFKDVFKSLFPVNRSRDGVGLWLAGNLFSGAFAGVISLIAGYPFEFMRVKMACDVATETGRFQFKGMSDVYIQTVREVSGVGMYRGFSAAAAYVIVHRALWLGSFNMAQEVIPLDASPLYGLLVAWLVTAASGTIAYPLNTIRTRLMITPVDGHRQGGAFSYGCQVVKKEGFRSLMRGAGVNVIRCLTSGTILALVDPFKVRYERWRAESAELPSRPSKFVSKARWEWRE